MLKKRVTLRDIARKTGHHYSTVSLALRGKLSLPAATRRTIVQAATAMGYMPDPMLKALAVYRTTNRPSTYHSTLALLVNHKKTVFRPDYSFSEIIQAIQQRAAELGYKVEEFLLRAPRMTGPRMVKILRSRGISGVLVSPQQWKRTSVHIDLDWSSFSCVNFGYVLDSPQLHRVAHHHFIGVQMAIRRVAALGYRRIGLCVQRLSNSRIRGGWIGGYFAEIQDHPMLPWIEPLLMRFWEGDALKEWIDQNRLDAVIIDYNNYIDRIRDDLNFAIPGRLGAASLHVVSGDATYAGINQHLEQTGRSAVDLLVNMLHNGDRGVPAIPQTLLIEGLWQDGATLRPAAPASAPD